MYMEVERKYVYMYIFFNKYTIIPCSNMVNLSMTNTSFLDNLSHSEGERKQHFLV